MRVASCPMGREIEGPPFVGPTERTYHCVHGFVFITVTVLILIANISTKQMNATNFER